MEISFPRIETTKGPERFHKNYNKGKERTDGFHQANVAFLNEIGVREAVAQKATSNGDYQAKMGEHEFCAASRSF